MVCLYTSKTAAEIKVIIGTLEDAIIDANTTGNQRIDYNGTEYEIKDFIKAIDQQLSMWNERLCTAEIQEGTKSKTKYFSRGDGMC